MQDRAESETIAIILLIALVVGLAGSILVWVNGFGEARAAPQVPMLASEDDEDRSCTAGITDTLFEIKHRSGLTFRWVDLTLQVLDGTTDHAPDIDWGEATVGELPTVMSVGDTLTASETTNICTAGASESWTVRIIQPGFENTIVYEQVIQVR